MSISKLCGIASLATLLLASAAASMGLDDRFNLLTTILLVSTPYGQTQGTGFFYNRLAPPARPDDPSPQWRAVQSTWLITNRHVVFPRKDAKEQVPSSLIFHLRKKHAGVLAWEPVVLDTTELLKRTLLHPNDGVDVVAIDVHDLLVAKIKSEPDMLQWTSVTPEQFAGNKNIKVESSDDVIIIGYPRGYYDHVNLFPIVKAGIIASRWGAHFDGNPYFLIDAKLFPGSSGSIVVSKPIDIVVKGGQLLFNEEKQFAFLGIYSSRPVQRSAPIEFEDMTIARKTGFGLGIVWYAEAIEEILAAEKRYANPP